MTAASRTGTWLTPWSLLALSMGLAFAISACAQTAPAGAVQQPAEQAKAAEQLKAKDQELAALKGQIAAAQKEAHFWQQLTAFMKPVELKSMTDHRAYMLPSGVLLALHFDHMNLDQAQNLNWIALGIPAKNCKEDQEQIEKAFGKGFTHFHELKKDTHGGEKGVEGVWFIHMAVREFDSPMSGGKLQAGPDLKFMPTPVQSCS